MKSIEILGGGEYKNVPDHVVLIESSKAVKLSLLITGCKVATFDGSNRISLQVAKSFWSYDQNGKKTSANSFTKPLNSIVSALLATNNPAIVNLFAKYGIDMYLNTTEETATKYDMVAVANMAKGFVINVVTFEVAEGSPRWQNDEEVYDHNTLHVEIESITPSTAQVEFFNEKTFCMEKTSQLVMNCRDFVTTMQAKAKAEAEAEAAETAATAALVTQQPSEL